MTEHLLPQERDLPEGRLAQMKDDLMTLIDHDLEETQPPAAPVAARRRRRYIGLAAAAVVAVAGFATVLVLGGGDDRASANTAVRTADGGILISINEGRNPKELQRRLVDLDVPAVVDFLDSGFGCDPARSTGWVEEPRGEALFTHADTPADEGPQYVLHPDQLQPGETVVLEFQIDEHGDDLAANVTTRLSTAPVGECVPVANSSVVDAEEGVAGG